MLAPARQRLTLQWEPALDTFDPSDAGVVYQEFRLLLLVDDELLLDVWEAGYGVDLGELGRSLRGGGFFYLLTCACGQAGCMGINEPVAVVHHAGEVSWHITSPMTRSLQFAYADYAAAIEAAQQALLQFLPRARAGLLAGDVRVLPDSFWHWPFVQEAA